MLHVILETKLLQYSFGAHGVVSPHGLAFEKDVTASCALSSSELSATC